MANETKMKTEKKVTELSMKKITANVPHIPEGGDCEALNFQ